MKDLQLFNYDRHQVRVVEQGGQTWFVAKDVCQALEMKQSTESALRQLDEDEKLMLIVSASDEIVANRGNWGVNESGLYHLIFNSRKPDAKAFRKWVTSEVLPSIRKTGGYQAPQEVGKPKPSIYYGVAPKNEVIYTIMEIEGSAQRKALYKAFKAWEASLCIR